MVKASTMNVVTAGRASMVMSLIVVMVMFPYVLLLTLTISSDGVDPLGLFTMLRVVSCMQ